MMAKLIFVMGPTGSGKTSYVIDAFRAGANQNSVLYSEFFDSRDVTEELLDGLNVYVEWNLPADVEVEVVRLGATGE